MIAALPIFPSTRLLVFSLLALAVTSAAGAERVALVIGVDSYDHLPPQSQLRVAVSDATLLSNALRNLDPPFDVNLLTNATQRQTEEALDSFVEAARGAECALVYFAGHGVEYHGENFLLVRDTAIDSISADVARMKRRLANDALSLQILVDDLDGTGAQVKLVILDACRNNPLVAEEPGGTRSLVGGSRGLAQVTPPSGSLIAYSADAGQEANDGLFTGVLVEQLQRQGLPLLEVFAATREEVLKRSTEMAASGQGVRHEPAEYTKLNLAGTKFAFSRGAATGPATPPVTVESDAMKAQIEELKKTVELLQRQGIENDALKERLAKMESTAKSDSGGIPATGSAIVTGHSPKDGSVPIPATASTTVPRMPAAAREIPTPFPASSSMMGSAAGEVRTFGGIEMVWCPPGTFKMGSPETELYRWRDETLHQVRLTRGFWLAKTECTRGQWKEAMGTGIPTYAVDGIGDFYEKRLDGVTELPISASWYDAKAWLKKMSEKHPLPEGWNWMLPTEAQWEYACRAGTQTVFAFGNTLTSHQANFNGKYPYTYNTAAEGPDLNEPAVVGTYPANSWGLHDMHGNLWEWCEDRFGEYPSGASGEILDPIFTTEVSGGVSRGGGWLSSWISWVKPPKNEDFRVLRSGAYTSGGDSSRSARRFKADAVVPETSYGFRPAVSTNP